MTVNGAGGLPGILAAVDAAGPWELVVAGGFICVLVAALAVAITYYVMRYRLGARRGDGDGAVVHHPPPRPAPAPKDTQEIPDTGAVRAETLDALRAGRQLHELDREALAEVVSALTDTDLDEVGDDLLREKIVRCVAGDGITQLRPEQAECLWGCVLSWSPKAEDQEKQTTDVLSWSCVDYGDHPEARPVVEHSRHGIPVPGRMALRHNLELDFDRDSSTLLDEGASAAVFKAHASSNRDVAVKISRLVDYSVLHNTLLEYFMLRRAQGIERVIRLYGAGYYRVGDDVYFFIVEEMAQTTLADEFERRRAAGKLYSERDVRDEIVKPLLVALVQLHSRGIIHRDLKPKNIYRVDGNCKIGDFEIAGYSRAESRVLETGTFAGSPAYTTAGALVGRYGPETDINAIACIGHMMLRGALPAMEDAPGTSTLIRGIRGGQTLSEAEQLRQDKAKRSVQEWLAQKRGFVTQIRLSPRSTPFERFFVAPIMAQGLYAEATPDAILTAEDALKALARVEWSEEAQKLRKRALSLAAKGEFTAARKLLVDFDARFNRRSPEEIEVSMHVMIGDTLQEIEDLESRPAPSMVLPWDNGERFVDDQEVDATWRYHEGGRAVGHRTDSICRISRDDQGIHAISLRIGEDEAKSTSALHGRSPQSMAGKFRLPDL